jgi:hypothetical protein
MHRVAVTPFTLLSAVERNNGIATTGSTAHILLMKEARRSPFFYAHCLRHLLFKPLLVSGAIGSIIDSDGSRPWTFEKGRTLASRRWQKSSLLAMQLAVPDC